ncbi:MAG: hypothetical protein C0483_05895 [Pirellula sp.]|nr:hypothetical protein [Pirellula sp.]
MDSKPTKPAAVRDGASVTLAPTTPTAVTTTPRPAWIDRPAGLYGGTFETKVLVGPESSRTALDQATEAAVRTKIAEYLGTFQTEAPGEPPTVIDAKLIDQVISEQWEEHVKTGDGESLFLHTQLRFDSKLQNKWQAEAQKVLGRARSDQLTRWFLTAIWLVAITHVALRCDVASTGRNGRVAAWVVAVILAIVPFLG